MGASAVLLREGSAHEPAFVASALGHWSGTVWAQAARAVPDLPGPARDAHRLAAVSPALHALVDLSHQQSARKAVPISRSGSSRDSIPFDGYGTLPGGGLPEPGRVALGPVSLAHESRYRRDGQPRAERHCRRPGPADTKSRASRSRSRYADQKAVPPLVRRPAAGAVARPDHPGRGLAPLPAAEIRWGLFAHTQRERHTRWDTGWVQAMVNTCRARGTVSLTELDLSSCTTFAGHGGPGDAA